MDVNTTNIDVMGSKLWTINFYREQLRHFAKVGLGNRTQHDVKVTETLIAVTKKRLAQLTTGYDNAITLSGWKTRKLRAERKLLSGQHDNNNGTTTASRMQSNGNIGSRRKRS